MIIILLNSIGLNAQLYKLNTVNIQLVALMDNWDFFKENLLTAQNATGELDKQQEIYLESVQAHLDQLEASWEGLYDTIFDEELIKNVADVLSTLVDGLNTFVTGWGGGLNNLIYPITLLGGALSTHLAENLVRIKTNAEAAQKTSRKLRGSTTFNEWINFS